MSTTPDQLVGQVELDGADKLVSDTEELAGGLASKMAAPAADAEATDESPTEQQQQEENTHAAAVFEPRTPAADAAGSEEDDNKFESVHQSNLESPPTSDEEGASSDEYQDQEETVMTSSPAPAAEPFPRRANRFESADDGNYRDLTDTDSGRSSDSAQHANPSIRKEYK